MSPLDPQTAERLNAALAVGRDELIGVLNALFLALPGVRTVTYLSIAADKRESRRIGTSEGAGFPEGNAEAIPDAWFQRICVDKRPMVGNTPDEMVVYLPETPELVAMGYGSTLCAPIVIGGRTRGTVNLLGDAGILTPSLLASLDALLPIAALLFSFEESSAR